MNPTRRAHPDSEHHDEARELRRIISEQREEIERLRQKLKEVFRFLENNHSPLNGEFTNQEVANHAASLAREAYYQNEKYALDGGGDDNATG